MAKRYLSISRCQRHPQSYAISVEDEDGNGTRLTSAKCCGSWNLDRRWPLSTEEWEEVAEQAMLAAEDTRG